MAVSKSKRKTATAKKAGRPKTKPFRQDTETGKIVSEARVASDKKGTMVQTVNQDNDGVRLGLQLARRQDKLGESMIDITGIVIIDIKCDKCLGTHQSKYVLEAFDNELIQIPLPEGWRRKYNRSRWEFWCENCFKCFRSHSAS